MRLAQKTGAPVILSHDEQAEPVVILGLDHYESLLDLEFEPEAPVMRVHTPSPQQDRFETSEEDVGDIERMELDLPVLETISTPQEPAFSSSQEQSEELPAQQSSQDAQFPANGEERFYLEPID